MRHRLVAVGIVGFWLVMMATLVRRWLIEIRPGLTPGTYHSVLTPERRNYQTRMGIYMPDSDSVLQRVGYTETVFFYGDDEKHNITNVTRVRVPVSGLLQRLATFDLDTTAVIGKGYNLERLTIILDSAMARAECRGYVIDGRLVLRTRQGDEEDVRELPLPPGGMVANGLSPLLALPPLRVGLRWSSTVVSPLTLKPSKVQIEVLRRERLEWEGETWDTHVVDIRSEYMSARAWVARDGEVLKETTLFGLTFIKERVPERTSKEAK